MQNLTGRHALDDVLGIADVVDFLIGQLDIGPVLLDARAVRRARHDLPGNLAPIDVEVVMALDVAVAQKRLEHLGF